ncbi:MAG: hypothetical protein MUF28_12595 [Ignavibacterium sp.]|jgi:hypothetical protein|nr:hypothetical protein [Ignavibacterium sp.]
MNTETHKNTITAYIINLAGSLMPLWLSALLFFAFDRWLGWGVFFDNGEFYLYSAALITPSAYILFTYKQKNYDPLAILFWISILILIISAVLFTAITATQSLTNKLIISINPSFLSYSSIIIFLFSIVVFYIANYTQNSRIDIGEKHRQEIGKIMKDLG